MKKSYFLMAAAAAMFAACSETEVLNVAQESAPKAIGFETFAGKATRATAENSGEDFSYDLEDHHTAFFVWGYKNTATDKVFDGVTVSHNGSAWNYTVEGVQNGVYWDKAADSYDFYAAAPTTASFWTLNAKSDDQADDYFTTAEFTVDAHNAASFATAATESFSGVTDAVDLMIANEEHVTTAIGSDVQLDFIHILSRLNITVATSLSNTVKLVSLTVNGLASTGSFDESKFADPSTGTCERWGKEVAGTWTAGAVDGTVNYAAMTDQTVGATAKYVLEALVMPQAAAYEDVEITETTFGAPYLTINYTIDGEPFKASYNLAAAFGSTSADLAFNEGWQNTLNITIGANAIKFTGKVAEWKDNPKNHPVGNN